MNPMWEVEQECFERGISLVCGADEAGAGPLAGPLCAGAVILRGTTIGDQAVIGAGSIVKGDVPAGKVFYQKRETIIK